MMTGVWLKNNQDPPIFWPAAHDGGRGPREPATGISHRVLSGNPIKNFDLPNWQIIAPYMLIPIS